MKKFSILKWLVALVLIVVLAFFGFTAEVREGECAVITRFGAPRAEITDAGLYLRLPWPFEDIVKYDARRQYLESNYLETLTRDKRNIILNSYVVWEISDPLTYYNSVRSADIAEQYIRDLVTNATNGVLGGYDLTALVSLLLLVCGLVLDTVAKKHRQLFEINLNMLNMLHHREKE